MIHSVSSLRLANLLKLLGVAALYALLAKVVLAYFSINGVVSVIWPSSGLALAALLIGGQRYFPSVFLGALLANVTVGVSLGVAAAIATGNTLEALVCAWLLTRGRFDPRFQSLRDYLRLVVLGGMSSGIAALNGATTLLVSGFFTSETYFLNLTHWWMGDTLGIILFAPLILVWQWLPADWFERRRRLEVMLLIGVVFLIGQVVFLGWFHDTVGPVTRGYWMFLFVTWTAVRLGMPGVVVILAMLAVQALLGAHLGTGFFADDIAKTQLTNYWFYMMSLSVTGMSLATYITSHKRSEQKLQLTQAAIDKSRSAFFRLSPEGVVLYANDYACQSLGYTRDELLGKHVWDFDPDFPPEAWFPMWVALRQIGVTNIETRHRRKDGTVFPVEVTGNYIVFGGEEYNFTFVQDISERKRIEQEKQELITYNQSLIETIPDAIFFKDALGRWLIANKAAKRLFKLHEVDWQGKTDMYLAATRPASRAVHVACHELDQKAKNQGGLVVAEMQLIGEEGQPRDFELRKALIFDEHGQHAGVVTIGRDITKRKRTEEALRKSERFAQAALDALSAHIAILDKTGTIIAVNRTWRLFAETNPPLHANVCEGANYLAVCEQAHGPDAGEAAAIAAGIRAVMRGEQAEFTLEYPCHSPDEKRWFIARVTPFAGDGASSVVVSHENITKRKQAEQELHIAATTFEVQEGIIITDSDKRVLRVNHAFTDLTGFGAEEVTGTIPTMFASGCHDAGFYRNMWETVAREHHWMGEIRDQRKNGEEFPAWLSISAVAAPDGSVSNYIGAFSDIIETKRAEEELKRHRDHLQELVNEQTLELRKSEAAAQHALAELIQQKFVLDQHAIVAVTDVEGHITYVNDKLCTISGYSREELLGQDHILLNSGHHPHGFFKKMYHTVAKGQPWHGEICNRAKDGHLYWVDTTIAPFMGDDGKPREYIAIRTDITERKRAGEAAEAANRAKSEFLANMSHEIRTPMNGVVGMVDILQETELSREQRRMVRTIRDSSLSLLGILDDILDFSKIEAGKLIIESIPVHLRDVVESVAQLMIPSTAAKGVDLYVFVSPDLPIWIVSDPVRLRQILFNLLGNAVKFTSSLADQRAQVMLRAESASLADGHPGLRLRVIDNGIGMQPEVVASLFRPFTQADESTTRHFGGTGLGLSITKRLAELLHGQISVHSTPGVGSEFFVELPLETSQPGHQLLAEPDLAGTRVLTVTGDAEYAEILPAYLGAAGAEVTVVADADSMRRQLGQSGGWTVLLDPQAAQMQFAVNEPGLADHARVVQLIRRRSSSSNAKEVTVPVNPLLYHDLIQGVAVASGRLSMTGDATKVERRQQPRVKAQTVGEAAAAGRLVLLAEDNETNRDVIQEQMRLLGYASEVAVNGREALQRWRSGRYALLLTDCHMPKMDGFQLTAAIRAEEPKGKRFPIVAVTANAMQGEAERCLENGMDDYLSKPVRLDELGPMLAKWLPLPEQQQEGVPGTSNEPADTPAHTSAAVWDASALSRLMGGDPAVHRRLLDKFLISAEEQVAAIGDAVAAGEPTVVADVAHKLKSAARTVGAMLLGEVCQELETAGRTAGMEAIPALVEQLNAAFSAAAEQIKRN